MHPSATTTKGRLLVATPPLVDANFDRTVVYMLEHSDDGAVGLVLNRPTQIPLLEPLDRWSDLESQPPGLFTGGPVESDALIAVGYSDDPDIGIDSDGEEGEPDDLSETVGRLGPHLVSVDLTADPALVGALISRVRVFRGYAGWGGYQLATEISSGAWIVVDAYPDDIFHDHPEDLWRLVLARQPGRLGWLANAPDDLSLN